LPAVPCRAQHACPAGESAAHPMRQSELAASRELREGANKWILLRQIRGAGESAFRSENVENTEACEILARRVAEQMQLTPTAYGRWSRV
jgi:hypothetical protein